MTYGVHVGPAQIKFLVDTGSPWIAISPGDAARLNIPVSSLPKAPEYVNVRFAGHNFQRHLLSNVKVYLRNEKGKFIRVNLESVSVLKSTKKLSEEAKQIPSVLGSDFLIMSKLRLCFDPSNKEGFFEKAAEV